jgi:tetrahydromethanopterin S-methyltransferase subunit A
MGWPIVSGRYVVGNPERSVAVCTLASSDMVDEFAGSQDIAIAGRLYSLNLGLEKLVWNVVSNAAIRFLLLCGDDSAMQVSRGIIQLHDKGIDSEHRLVGLEGGYQPFVHNLTDEEITAFQQRIELVDHIGLMDVQEVLAVARELEARTPGPAVSIRHPLPEPEVAVPNKMGEITLDGLGMFLVGIERGGGTITLDRYSSERRYLGRITGTSAEAICHTLVRDGLVSELSHAAYLGREVAKAEEALRWGLQFEQDRALFAPGQGGQWTPFGPRSSRGA